MRYLFILICVLALARASDKPPDDGPSERPADRPLERPVERPSRRRRASAAGLDADGPQLERANVTTHLTDQRRNQDHHLVPPGGTEPDRRLYGIRRERPTTVSFHTIDKFSGQRNTTFQLVGQIYPGRDFAHLFSYINFNDAVECYNKLVKELDNAQLRVINRQLIKGPGLVIMNSSFMALHEELRDAGEAISFTCALIICEDKLGSSSLSKGFRPRFLDNDMKYDHLWGATSGLYQSRRRRKKRQLMAAALGAASIGLSIYSINELKDLRSELLKQNNGRIVAEQLLHQQTILNGFKQEIEEISVKLGEIHTWAKRTEYTLGFTLISFYLGALVSKLIRWTKAVNDVVISKRFDPQFFDLDHLNKAIASIKRKSNVKGLKMLSIELDQLIEEAVSYEIENGKLFFALHIPLGRGAALDLYKFVDTPLVLSDGHAVRIKPETALVAIDKKVTERLELSENDLLACLKRKRTYLCNHGITNKRVSASCLGALFLGLLLSVKVLCSFQAIFEPHENMVQVGGNEVLLYTPPRMFTSVFVTCDRHDQSKQLAVTDHTFIKVPSDCVLSTPTYVFLPERSFSIKEVFVHRPIFNFQLNLTDLPFDEPIFSGKRLAIAPVYWPKSEPATEHAHASLGVLILIGLMLILLFTALVVLGKRRWAQRVEHVPGIAVPKVDKEGLAPFLSQMSLLQDRTRSPSPSQDGYQKEEREREN